MKNLKIFTQISLCVGLSLVTMNVSAYNIRAFTQDLPVCDRLEQMEITHELGEPSAFPDNELIVSSVERGQPVCVGDDGMANDWLVRITNRSGTAWQDMMFVADAGFAIGNLDGSVFDVASNTATDAFMIDPFGVNRNLLFESMTANVIFEPGETWEFLVTNYTHVTGAPGAIAPFDSLGIGSSSALGFASTASIVANPVIPIPPSVFLFASGLLGLIGVARRIKKVN